MSRVQSQPSPIQNPSSVSSLGYQQLSPGLRAKLDGLSMDELRCLLAHQWAQEPVWAEQNIPQVPKVRSAINEDSGYLNPSSSGYLNPSGQTRRESCHQDRDQEQKEKMVTADPILMDLAKAVENNPKNCMAHIRLGQTMHAKGLLTEAEELYQKAIVLDPKVASDAHYGLGLIYQTQNQLDKAHEQFTKATAANSTNPKAYYAQGLVCVEKHDWHNAILAFRKAVEQNHYFADAYVRLGLALKDQQRIEDKLAEYQKLITSITVISG